MSVSLIVIIYSIICAFEKPEVFFGIDGAAQIFKQYSTQMVFPQMAVGFLLVAVVIVEIQTEFGEVGSPDVE